VILTNLCGSGISKKLGENYDVGKQKGGLKIWIRWYISLVQVLLRVEEI